MTECPGGGVEVVDLGLISWQEALELQMRRVEEVEREQAPPALFLLEHPPVITLGRSGNTGNLLVSRETLRQRGVELVHARRGGDVTCHFPGQLVAYPIVRVAARPGGLRRLFHDLEQSVIDLLSCFAIQAGREQGRPGVWVQGRKIASIGLGMRRWVSFHGLALNVAYNIDLFSMLTPCGLAGVRMTSMEREREAAGCGTWQVAMQEVKNVFVREFGKNVAPA